MDDDYDDDGNSSNNNNSDNDNVADSDNNNNNKSEENSTSTNTKETAEKPACYRLSCMLASGGGGEAAVIKYIGHRSWPAQHNTTQLNSVLSPKLKCQTDSWTTEEEKEADGDVN
ncbi:GM21835 [Drosophila sechellia]|uniref:GM21835 n=1 Tax=Drosophila sechellia TaxID=7238 RepID=B4HNA0_DROSE|nr:GM21835 [Drosophila sechellia]